MERYTAINGEVIEYPTPDAETSAFLARVVAMANDPNASEFALHELIYGRENPILDQTVFAGRGAVTREVFENPLYGVLLDLIAQKQVLSGRLNLARASDNYTLSVADAATRIGVTDDAVRKAIQAKRLPAWKRGGSWWLNPRDCDTYRAHVVPRKPRTGGKADGPALVVRAGSEPGRSLRVKAPGKRVTGKDGTVTTIEVDQFEQVAIATTSTKTMRVFILEPDARAQRIEWGVLGVEGRFRVVQEITRLVDATKAWKAFRAF